eukprot:1560579-Pleurochrysis_carterae.AAC.1
MALAASTMSSLRMTRVGTPGVAITAWPSARTSSPAQRPLRQTPSKEEHSQLEMQCMWSEC